MHMTISSGLTLTEMRLILLKKSVEVSIAPNAFL